MVVQGVRTTARRACVHAMNADGFSVSWGEKGGAAWIEMRVPLAYLTRFPSHGAILADFLIALEARGVNIMATDLMKVSYRPGMALLIWNGQVGVGFSAILPRMVKELEG